jgi:hypothetical protein
MAITGWVPEHLYALVGISVEAYALVEIFFGSGYIY